MVSEEGMEEEEDPQEMEVLPLQVEHMDLQEVVEEILVKGAVEEEVDPKEVEVHLLQVDRMEPLKVEMEEGMGVAQQEGVEHPLPVVHMGHHQVEVEGVVEEASVHMEEVGAWVDIKAEEEELVLVGEGGKMLGVLSDIRSKRN